MISRYIQPAEPVYRLRCVRRRERLAMLLHLVGAEQFRAQR